MGNRFGGAKTYGLLKKAFESSHRTELTSLSEAHKVSKSIGKGQSGQQVESPATNTLSDLLTTQMGQHTGGSWTE